MFFFLTKALFGYPGHSRPFPCNPTGLIGFQNASIANYHNDSVFVRLDPLPKVLLQGQMFHPATSPAHAIVRPGPNALKQRGTQRPILSTSPAYATPLSQPIDHEAAQQQRTNGRSRGEDRIFAAASAVSSLSLSTSGAARVRASPPPPSRSRWPCAPRSCGCSARSPGPGASPRPRSRRSPPRAAAAARRPRPLRPPTPPPRPPPPYPRVSLPAAVAVDGLVATEKCCGY